MNPIILNYEYNKNALHICEGKTFKKNFNIDHFEESENIENQNLTLNQSTYTNIPYGVTYDYPQFATFKFSMMTDFLPLKYHSISYKNKFNKCVTFGLEIDRANAIHIKFLDTLVSIMEKIQTLITSSHGDSTQHPINFSFPYNLTEESKELVTIHLKSIAKAIDPADKKNRTHYNVCPIAFHRSKAKGGDVVTIHKDSVDNMTDIINREMPMFKNPFYMKKSTDPKYANKEDIHYVGKFVFGIDIELSKYETPSLNQHNISCKISLVATEMEIKHNVSHCSSVFLNDIISVNVNDKSFNTLTI